MSIRNTYVEDNIRLVYACAKKFINRGSEYDDMVQAGCIGLVKAAKAFDESRGVAFSTYAVPVILGEIKQLFREAGAIKVSRGLKDLSIKIRRQVERFEENYGRKPSIGELSDALGVDREQIFEALEASRYPISLTAHDESGTDEIDVPVEFDDEMISSKISLINAVNSLDKRDRRLIFLRFFKGQTQSEVAKTLGVTQVCVSRREKNLLITLRKMLS